jgi:hypothetical protein
MRKRKTVDIRIDCGIEMPAASISGERNYRFRFRKMEIGDSFPVPDCLRISSFWATAARMGRLTGMRFATRPWGGHCYRCWRVK